ncbi:MAG TPA: AsmA-like C-terminal region-containing protein [Lacunisphaera sp.]|nr:AsmA-like C-terminal region-containing protein [Lacunisphaera sp.]
MKFARPLLILLAVLVALGVLAVGLALTPAIQRRLVLRAVASTPGLAVQVEEVAAGFSGVRLRQVDVKRGDLHVQVARLEADYSLWRLLVGRRLQVRRLEVAGLVVDARRIAAAGNQAAAAAAGTPVVAPGLLAHFQLPVALELDGLHVAGRVLVPAANGQPALENDFNLTGGGIAPGREGTLELAAELRNPAAGAHVAALNAKVGLRAHQTAERTFDHIGLTAVADAEGENFSDQNQLKITGDLARTATGEAYSCRIDTLRHGEAGQVLALNATLPAGARAFAGDWTLKVSSGQLEPFALGGLLPDFNVRGTGRFSLDPAAQAASVSGQLDGDVRKLEVIDPAWRAFGAIRLQAQFDVTGSNGVAQLRQLSVKLAGEQPVLELQATQAAEFNLKDRRLQVGGASPGEVLTLNISGLPVAWVRPFVHAVDISGGMVTGKLVFNADPDKLVVRVTEPVRIASLSAVQEGQLLLAKADLGVAGEAALTAGEIQATLSEFSLHTPAGDAVTLKARATVPIASPNPGIVVAADYTADLPGLLAPWLPLGHIKASGATEFTLAGSQLELRRLTADVTDGAGLPLFKAGSLRPFRLDLATRQATVAGAGAGPVDLLKFALGRIPLDRVPLNQPGAKLGGTVEQGAFVLAADGSKLALRSVEPLKLAGVSLAQDGQPALSGLAIEARPSAEIEGPESVAARTGDVTIRTADGGSLVTLQGEATRKPDAGLRASLSFNLEVPALATQPLFPGAKTITQGRASGEVRAAAGADIQVEARLTLNGLVARDTGQTLPVANLSFRAVTRPDGHLSVEAPLLLDRSGQRTDLKFALELQPHHGVFGLDGSLAGEHVELGDALSLVGVFLASADATGKPAAVASTPAAGPAAVGPDAKPPWSHFDGRLALDIKTVSHGADWAMTGLTGLVNITPTSVTLAKLEAAFGENSRLTAKGDLNFSPGDQPYDLAGDFSLTEFDAGKLFKALEPGKPPTVEGTFTVNGRLGGKGETLQRTLERTRGQFSLTSRKGVFRGLQRTSGKVSLTSKAVELGASVLGSLLGSQKGTKAAEKVAGTAYFVDQLAQSLAELNYDQLNVRLVRDDALNMRLEDFSLVSPELRLLGKGTVTYQADKPLLEQPLSVTLTLAGRNKMEQLLGKIRLLDGTRDELGYAKVAQPVVVTGTLARPDPSAFFTKIAASKLTDFLSPDN